MKLELSKMPNGKPEVFYTIQGEGASIGKPAVFLRTSTCNLYCVWCDTPYTWNWDNTPYEHKDGVKYNRKEQSVKMEVEDIVALLSTFACKRIVLTGGEPMLQQKALIALMEQLPSHFFEVETNGTKELLPQFSSLIGQVNCSPKLSGSGNALKVRETPYLAQYIAHPRSTFKFVVGSLTDFEETLAFIQNHAIPKEKVYLMPEGRTPDEVADKTSWLVEAAKREGLCMTPRLHVIIWGAKRGV